MRAIDPRGRRSLGLRPPTEGGPARATGLLAAAIVLLGCAPDRPPPATGGGRDGGRPTDGDVGDGDAGPPVGLTGPDVVLVEGPLRGEVVDGVARFRGVPYAVPPVRFAGPVPVEPWTDRRSALAPGPRCGFEAPQSEDCLTLDVWAPLGRGERRPVLVFFAPHNNAPRAAELYDGERLARRGNLVVVRVEARGGLLGYFTAAALRNETEGGRDGNQGLLDRLEALRFVARNATRLGGDPDAITVFGSGQAALVVCAMLAMEEADTLFARAIIGSGGGCDVPTPTEMVAGRPSIRARHQEMLEGSGCADDADPLGCLRAIPGEELLGRLGGVDYATSSRFGELLGTTPLVDGVTVPEAPLARRRRGEGPRRALVFGATRDNGRAFSILLPGDGDLTGQLARLTGTRDDEELAILEAGVRSTYAPSGATTDRDIFEALIGDLVFQCPALDAAKDASRVAPVWTYRYDHDFGLAVEHAQDSYFLFGNLEARSIPDTEANRAAVALMQDTFLSFITSGAPSRPDGWNAATGDRAPLAVLDVPARIETPPHAGRCEGLRSLGL